MQSRRDQVQAHLFVIGRLATGMLRGEPDAPDTPIGRTSRGTAAGIAIGLVICLGLGAFGFIMPGGATGWRKDGTLVEVKESGARYLYLAGELHPVLNQASAQLISGSQMVVDQVSEASLTGVVRGIPIGIVGAPDSLPSSGELTSGPWLACATQAPNGNATTSGSGTGASAGMTLAVAPVDEGTPLTDTQALLAVTPAGEEFLLWHGERLGLPSPNTASQALGYAAATPTPVTAALMNTLPAGPELAAPAVVGMGTAGPLLAGQPTRLGQLFVAASGDHYLLTAAGLEPLTPTLFDLVRGDPIFQRGAYAGGPVAVAPIGPADLAAHAAPAAPAAPPGTVGSLPPTPPTLAAVSRSQELCIGMQLATTDSPAISVSVVNAAALVGHAPAAMPGVTPGCGGLDAVSLPPGGGAWLRSLSGAGVGATTYLVTDAGVKFPVPSAQAATQLGYSAVTPLAAPQNLLDLLPTGPSLDPAALEASAGIVSPAPGAPICPEQATPTASPSAG